MNNACSWTRTNTPFSDYSQFSKLLPYQIRIMQAKVGRRGLEPPEAEADGFTDRTLSHYVLEACIRQGVCISCKHDADALAHCYQLRDYLPKSAVHRIRTCKSSRTNGFQDRSLTTQTCSIIWKCGCWDSNPNHQIHNLRY